MYGAKGGMIVRFLFAWMLFLAVPAIAAEPVDSGAGHYRLTGVQDAASELELSPDGHFRFYLIYGALDERAEGMWRRQGTQLLLTTQPTPVPPQFLLKNAEKTATPGLSVSIAGPDGKGIAGIDITVRFDDGSEAAGYTQEDGWRMAMPAGRKAETISLAILMYGVRSPLFPLDVEEANRLAFLLEPNDLGRVDFRDLPLKPGRDYVEMLRDGEWLRYERVK